MTAANLATERLHEELEEKVWIAQESETQAKVEEAFFANTITQLTSDLTEMRGKAESAETKVTDAEDKVAAAEAKVKAFEEEMEGVATEALYLAWSYNRSMDLSFLGGS